MALMGPEPMSTNPLRRVAFELQTERRARGGYPPGDNTPSLRRTHRMIADPLALLLDADQPHGPAVRSAISPTTTSSSRRPGIDRTRRSRAPRTSAGATAASAT